MKLKSTQKRAIDGFRKVFLLLCLWASGQVNAQTLSTASGTGYLGNFSINNPAPLSISFVIENTTGSAVVLTDLSCQLGPFGTVAFSGDPVVTKLFYSTTSISGNYDLSAPGVWTQIGSGSATVPAVVTVTPVITGLSLVIPPATQYRFVFEASKGLRFSFSPTPTPNIFSTSGLNLKVGNAQVAAQDIGWAGVSPVPAAGNHPAFFGGTATLIPAIPCSGTPAPGNTISSANPVCPTIGFNLTLQNPTAGSGVTYQWQSGPSATGPWTNVGPNSPTYSTSQTVATFYRCQVTCGANTGTSTPVSVGMTPASSCYCIPPASDCTDNDVITRVRISTLDNSSTCGSGPPLGYSNFTALPAPTVYSNAPNPITLDLPANWTEQLAVWIDYNQNGAFEVAEFSNIGTKAAGSTFITGNINIPASALNGTTRMRVRASFSTALTGGQACTAIPTGFGETEDYNVTITPCVPVSIVTPPVSSSIGCGSNASFTVTVAGTLPSYSWQYRTGASSVWLTVPNAAPFSGVNTNVLTILNTPVAFSGYQFRALVTGGCSAVDFTTPPATLTVTPAIPVVDPAAASICKGSIQSLKLLNQTNDATLVNEGFDIAVPLPAGWFAKNNSTPVGVSGWFQGIPGIFPSNSGIPASYIAANFRNVSGANTISNWLLTPEVAMKNGDIFTFYTRKVAPDFFPDRLEVRLSSNGASTDVGTTNTSVGDFTNLLLTINPTLITGVYPIVWTKYTVTVSGLAAPATGRMAFRYFVTDGGAGSNSDYIGIDDVTYVSKGGPINGVWTGPAGTMFTDAAATTAYTGTPANTIWVKPDVTSDYEVSFTTIFPTACTSEKTIVPVSVSEPVSNLVNPANKAVCVGGTTTFTVSADGGPFVYQWQVSTDGGLTFTNIPGAVQATLTLNAVTQMMNGNQYRCLLDVTACASSAITTAAVLTVNTLPVVTLTSPDQLLTPGQTTSITASSSPAAAGGWVWNYNGSVLAGATTNTVSGIDIDKIGTYAATVTDINGCSNTSANMVIGAEVSDRLWIYPNPTTGAFQVRLYHDPNGYFSKRAVYVYNNTGQLMISREFDIDSRTTPYLRMDFDLGKAAPGTYVVKVVHKYTGKVVSGLIVVQ